MKHKRIFQQVFLIFSLALVSCSWNLLYSQINVMHIDNNTTPDVKQGIFYALPRTIIKVDVSIDRIENYKGPYADYALRFMGLKNVVESNSVEYKINYIRITTTAEPDPNQYYFIGLPANSGKNERTNLFTLSESGLILGVLPDINDT